MAGKFSFFTATLQYVLLPFRKQQFLDFLADFSETVPEDLCCQDILEIWLDSFGAGGLLLGNIALFAIGFIVMVIVDILISRSGSGYISIILNSVTALLCLRKFRVPSSVFSWNLLILFYIGFSLLSGFYWGITFLFLIGFTNLSLHKGGSSQ